MTIPDLFISWILILNKIKNNQLLNFYSTLTLYLINENFIFEVFL